MSHARPARPAWEPGLGAVVARVDGHRVPSAQGPLAGLRLGVKDLVAVAGVPRRCGAPDLVDDGPQPRDAPVVTRLVEAGARVVATTATHPFAYGTITPGVGNPRAPGRVAGGSSGGSAAGLAAGLWDVALGTDTGGSIRIPAAFCGVVGLKPTYGRVPVEGVFPLAPALDTVGALARDVATCAAAIGVLLGRDLVVPADQHLRVGVLRALADLPLDLDVRAEQASVLADLAAAGVTLVDVDLPLDEARRVTGLLLDDEARAGHAARLASTPAEAWAPDVRRRLLAVQPLVPDQARALLAWRDGWRRAVADVLRGVDVLVLPVTAAVTPRVGERRVLPDGALDPAVDRTRLTNPWNLAGVPAGSVPTGRDGSGAPLGTQVVGPDDGEALVLGVMARLEALRGGPLPAVPPPAPG